MVDDKFKIFDNKYGTYIIALYIIKFVKVIFRYFDILLKKRKLMKKHLLYILVYYNL